MKFRLSKSNWPRLLLQWGVIAYLVVLGVIAYFGVYTPDFEAYCPFGGIQALGSYLINNSLTCSMTSAQIVIGVAMMIGVFLLGKLFCSFICPIGTLSEWLGKLGDKIKVRITINGILDKALRIIKYALLFITLYYTLDSSELFCKKFDPFFAVATGFDPDVVVLWSSISIFLVIIGSIFIRLFWCKYLCPFGALANVFKFTGFFVLVLGVYILLYKFGLELSYVWPLAIACVGGFIIEISNFKSRFFPVAKITRNTDSCTDCQLCSMSCPQAIDVASLEVVRDTDCNLCSDCVVACPAPKTLHINKRNKLKWLAPIGVVVLTALGIYIGTFFEIPTIDQQWYEPSKIAKAEVYSRSGLKNIKCYGSTVSFANQMRKVNGVMGVQAFVGSKTVKIFYDPKLLDETKIEKAIFTPQKSPIRTMAKDVEFVQKVSVPLDLFFDNLDFSYLSILLKQKTEAVGLSTDFGCPVIANIYFPSDVEIDEDELTEIVETRNLKYTYREAEKHVKLKYEVKGDIAYQNISKADYVKLMFKPYSAEFNRYENYREDVIASFRVPMGKNRAQARNLKYLASHLYNHDEVLALKTLINDDLIQVLEVNYVDTMASHEDVLQLINSDTLFFTYSSGKKGTIKNMFDFMKIDK